MQRRAAGSHRSLRSLRTGAAVGILAVAFAGHANADGPSSGGPSAHVSLLTDAEAWNRLPAAYQGGDQPLPAWARALADALPRTTAAMINLDHRHRATSPLGAELAGKLRLVVARQNRCGYSQAFAVADLRRIGLDESALAELDSDRGSLSDPERIALAFAKNLTRDGASVTDEEVAELKAAYGDELLTAIVLLVAHANFQDRLFLTLGIEIEPNGPLPPLEVNFATADPKFYPPVPAREPPDGPAPPEPPLAIDDPEWRELDFDALQSQIETQRSRAGRIAVPDWEFVKSLLPKGSPVKQPIRIQWSLVCLGYQPELAFGWSSCTRAFGEEARQDRVFEESQFWVITRSIHCFY